MLLFSLSLSTLIIFFLFLLLFTLPYPNFNFQRIYYLKLVKLCLCIHQNPHVYY